MKKTLTSYLRDRQVLQKKAYFALCAIFDEPKRGLVGRAVIGGKCGFHGVELDDHCALVVVPLWRRARATTNQESTTMSMDSRPR